MSEGDVPDVRPEKETSSGVVPDRILLATDGSKGSELAARTAAGLSRKLGSSMYLIHVMPVSSFHSGFGAAGDSDEGDTLTIYEEDVGQAQDLLDEQVKQLEEESVAVEKAELRTGEPDAEVVNFAEEVGVDLVVVGSRGTGAFKRAPMGSVSDAVLRHAHCPVLVVREQESKNDGKQA
ncbi:MAG: universal stress protein [Rubrobacteraceae bacterium]